MRDFPVFTTENGVGSLVLKEIPYTEAAYVTIRDSSSPREFIEECGSFCRAVGAKTVYASGHCMLEEYPLHTAVYQMSLPVEMIPETDACTFPVTDTTLDHWRTIYNEKMKYVDNAAYMSENAAKEMLKRGNGYFVHKQGKLLGIGIASDDRVDCLASVCPGKGKEILAALTHVLCCEVVQLEVASTNHKAISLYETMGFIKTKEVSRWYKIF